MEHSKRYTQVKGWYLLGLWSRERVIRAVASGWITQEECDEILGETNG